MKRVVVLLILIGSLFVGPAVSAQPATADPAGITTTGFGEASAPAESVGGVWPPEHTNVMDPVGLPLHNTQILLCSGTTLTRAHQALINGDRRGPQRPRHRPRARLPRQRNRCQFRPSPRP